MCTSCDLPFDILLAYFFNCLLMISGIVEAAMLIYVRSYWGDDLHLSWIMPVVAVAALLAFVGVVLGYINISFNLSDTCWSPIFVAALSIALSILVGLVFYGKEGEEKSHANFFNDPTINYFYLNMPNYGKNLEATLKWNKMHIESDCCGSRNHEDWKKSKVTPPPISCCKDYTLQDLQVANSNGNPKIDIGMDEDIVSVKYDGHGRRDRDLEDATVQVDSGRGKEIKESLKRNFRSLATNKTCDTNKVENLRNGGRGCFVDVAEKYEKGIVILKASIAVAIVLQTAVLIFTVIRFVKKFPAIVSEICCICWD